MAGWIDTIDGSLDGQEKQNDDWMDIKIDGWIENIDAWFDG